MTLLLLSLACTEPLSPESELNEAFAAAADESDIPVDLLIATSYAFSRFDGRGGAVSKDDAVGMMNLHLNGEPSLDKGAALIGASAEDVEIDDTLNIRAGAALMRTLADQQESLLGAPVESYEQWYPIVARFSGADEPMVAEGFAGQVYDILEWGLLAEAPSGEVLEVAPNAFPWRTEIEAMVGSSLIDHWIPASSSNYSNYSRTSVSSVVIHTMQGSYSGSISWFQNSASGASAHYMVRSSDGEVTQMVDEADVAWHAGHWSTNESSIGIEHEGYIESPGTWYTEAMYQSSAALTRDICDRYGIPKDRSHIFGHNEVPGCSSAGGGGSSCHTDPGSGWDWDYFMDLVQNGSGGAGAPGGGSGSPLVDGAQSGTFTATVRATRYGAEDTCTGALSGTASNDRLYLTGTCAVELHGKTGTVRATWSGEASGTAIQGTLAVDGYAHSWAGVVHSDGTVDASMSGSEDLGGDVGVIEYDAEIATN